MACGKFFKAYFAAVINGVLFFHFTFSPAKNRKYRLLELLANRVKNINIFSYSTVSKVFRIFGPSFNQTYFSPSDDSEYLPFVRLFME